VTRFRKVPFVIWTIFLAVTLPGFGGLGESVLCFGADGHVAFETAAPGGVCFSASGRIRTSLADSDLRLGVSSRQDHCGPCVDFRVLVNDIGRGFSPMVFHKTNQILVVGGTSAALADLSMPGIRTASLHSGIRFNLADPISLRNTVLLI
jgi:hypothetical protein